MAPLQDQSLDCEFCVKLDFTHLEFIDFDSLQGKTFATYDEPIMVPNQDIKDWLETNNIPYSFVFVRTISDQSEPTGDQSSRTRSDITLSFFLEFTCSRDAVQFRLTWS